MTDILPYAPDRDPFKSLFRLINLNLSTSMSIYETGN